MIPKEIIKNNKLIAEFMGWRLQYEPDPDNKRVCCYKFYKPGDKNPSPLYFNIEDIVVAVSSEKIGWKLISKYTKYNCSWDKLMPVVEKIGSTDCSSIDIHWGTGCTDSFAWCNIEWSNGKRKFITSDNINQDEQSLIKAVWVTIVEFIKWYNENKN